MLKINGSISLLGLTACGGNGGGSSAVVANGVSKIAMSLDCLMNRDVKEGLKTS